MKKFLVSVLSVALLMTMVLCGCKDDEKQGSSKKEPENAKQAIVFYMNRSLYSSVTKDCITYKGYDSSKGYVYHVKYEPDDSSEGSLAIPYDMMLYVKTSGESFSIYNEDGFFVYGIE